MKWGPENEKWGPRIVTLAVKPLEDVDLFARASDVMMLFLRHQRDVVPAVFCWTAEWAKMRTGWVERWLSGSYQRNVWG